MVAAYCFLILLFLSDEQKTVDRKYGHSGPAIGFTISNDGQTLATFGWDNKIKLWDLISGKQLGKDMEHGHWIYDVVFTDDNSMAISGGGDGLIKIWSVKTTELIATSRNHGWAVFRVANKLNGQRIVGGTDRAATIWNLTDGKLTELHSLNHSYFVGSCAIIDNNTVITSGNSNSVKMWNIQADARIAKEFLGRGEVTSISVSLENKLIFICDRHGDVSILDIDSLKLLHRIEFSSTVYCVAIDKKNKLVAAADSSGTFKLCSFSNGFQERHSVKLRSGVACVSFSTDGSMISCGCSNGDVVLLKANNNSPARILYTTGNKIKRIGFAVNDTRIIIADSSDAVSSLRFGKTK